MAISSRAYEGRADLRLMQALQQELWGLERERTQTHVGDLAWMSTHAPRESEWTRQLWLDGDRCVAWTWVDRGTSLEYQIHPRHRGGPLHDDVLDWFESGVPPGGLLTVWWMEGDDVSLPLLDTRAWSSSDARHPARLRSTLALGDTTVAERQQRYPRHQADGEAEK
jgi:hypothetical protein